MKKKNFRPLRLHKKSISSFMSIQVLGGNSKINKPTLNPLCKSDRCSSDAFQDCTVTHEACITQLRFCGSANCILFE